MAKAAPEGQSKQAGRPLRPAHDANDSVSPNDQYRLSGRGRRADINDARDKVALSRVLANSNTAAKELDNVGEGLEIHKVEHERSDSLQVPLQRT